MMRRGEHANMTLTLAQISLALLTFGTRAEVILQTGAQTARTVTFWQCRCDSSFSLRFADHGFDVGENTIVTLLFYF
jgi:hypothetical protein